MTQERLHEYRRFANLLCKRAFMGEVLRCYAQQQRPWLTKVAMEAGISTRLLCSVRWDKGDTPTRFVCSNDHHHSFPTVGASPCTSSGLRRCHQNRRYTAVGYTHPTGSWRWATTWPGQRAGRAFTLLRSFGNTVACIRMHTGTRYAV